MFLTLFTPFEHEKTFQQKFEKMERLQSSVQEKVVMRLRK